MKSIEDHRAKLREICDFAFAHGINAIEADVEKYSSPDKWSDSIKNTFLIKCHEGFKKAQEIIIEEIKFYQSRLRESTIELKDSRRNRDKIKIDELTEEIEILNQRVKTFSHLADGIAWQLICGQIHVARRFYISEESKYLDSSNIEHALKVANEINEDPENFALISDITNFIQIGDLLVRHKDKLGIMELKEGKVNDSIADFLNKMDAEGKETTNEDLKDKFDAKTIKQIERVKRQKVRSERAIEVINNDSGTDPAGGGKITIDTPTIETEYYFEKIHELQVKLKDQNWAHGVLDNGCVHLGLYKDKGLAMAPIVIEGILKMQTKNYMMIDFMSIVDNVSQPIFAKPFDPEFLIDILTGKIKLIIGIDFDLFIAMFNDVGLKARWLSNKETIKNKEKEVRKTMFVINGKGIEIASRNQKSTMIVGGGIISKILYDNIYPSNIAFTLREGILGEKE